MRRATLRGSRRLEKPVPTEPSVRPVGSAGPDRLAVEKGAAAAPAVERLAGRRLVDHADIDDAVA